MLQKIIQKYKNILPVIIILLLPLAFFFQIFQGNIIVAGDFSGSDLLDLHLPFKYALHDAVSQKLLPLWNSDLAMGFPLLAEGQTGAFYPTNLLFSLLKPYMSLNFSILCVFFIASLGMYLYVRSLSFTRFSALFAAIVFSNSAFFITRIKHLNMIAVAAWVPFAFFLIKKAFETRRSVYVAILGMVIGMQLLAGHPNMAFLCVFVYLIYFLFEVVANINSKDFGKNSSILFGITSAVSSLILAVGISSIQLIPTIELIGLSPRGSSSFESASAYPFTLKSLATFFAPYSSGNPATGSYNLNIYSEGIFWENASYIGLLPFGLFCYLILSFLWTKRETFRSFFSGKTTNNSTKHVTNLKLSILRLKEPKLYLLFFLFLSFLSLLLMLGSGTPVFKFLWDNVPGFSLFRFPNRFNLFLILSLTVISSYTAETLLGKLVALKNRSIATSSESNKKDSDEEIGLSWPLERRGTAILFLAFVIADLWVFANSYVGYVNSVSFLKIPPLVERLQKDDSQFRIYSTTQYGENPYQLLGWKNSDSILSFLGSVAPNRNIIYNLSSFNDRGWFEGGLSIERRNAVEEFLLYENKNDAVLGKVLGLFNIKYLIGFGPIPAIEMYTEEEYDLGSQFAQKLTLPRNDQVLPRVYFVPEAKVVESERETFNNIVSLEHLGPKTVILEDKPEIIPPEFNGILDEFKKENPLDVEIYSDTKVTINASIKSHGFLVLSDLFYPGWKVYINGNPGRILRANYLVRAVELTPGNHKVEFVYDPLSFKLGAVVSLVSLVFLFLYPFYKLSKRIVLKRSNKK